MSAPQFIPLDFPQCDYLITNCDSDEVKTRLTSLGATRHEMGGVVLYIWDFRPSRLMMLGVGVLDGRLRVGPQQMERTPRSWGAGNYTVLDFRSPIAKIIPDPFGINLTYFGNGLVTNRLHLAALICQGRDELSALTAFHGRTGFSFNFNSFDTPIEGISLLQADSMIRMSGTSVEAVSFTSNEDFSALSYESYWGHIEKGAEEIVENVTAVADSPHPAIADITGGKDSRLVLGALVAAGRNHDVIFNTIANPTNPTLETDLRIGTGLVDHYGGSYGPHPRTIGYSLTNTEHNLERRRSQLFGAYHWMTPSDIRPISALKKTLSIRMLGGGGELYRDNWRAIEFPWVDADEEYSAERMLEVLKQHRGKDFVGRYPEEALDKVVTTFDALPGRTMGEKIDSHYVNFRCRLHFGARPLIPEMMSSINLAMSPSLLRAYRGLPAQDRAMGRVLFDVMSVFDADLPYFELEVPFSEKIFDSPFHRSSRSAAKAPMLLEGAPHLAQTPPSVRNPVPPIAPTALPWEFDEIVTSEIHSSLEMLRGIDSLVSDFVDSEQMEAYISWAKEKSPSNYAATASKLRALADYIERP